MGSRHADEMDEVARAWLLRAELAKSAVENLRVHMDLRANQAGNRNSLVQPGTAMLQIPLTEESLGSLALPSRGSEHHATGNCNPCAWFHSNKGAIMEPCVTFAMHAAVVRLNAAGNSRPNCIMHPNRNSKYCMHRFGSGCFGGIIHAYG